MSIIKVDYGEISGGGDTTLKFETTEAFNLTNATAGRTHILNLSAEGKIVGFMIPLGGTASQNGTSWWFYDLKGSPAELAVSTNSTIESTNLCKITVTKLSDTSISLYYYGTSTSQSIQFKAGGYLIYI